MRGLPPLCQLCQQNFPFPHYKTNPPIPDFLPPFLVRISHPPIIAIFEKFHPPDMKGAGEGWFKLWYRCYPLNFVKFQTPFSIEHHWLLLS